MFGRAYLSWFLLLACVVAGCSDQHYHYYLAKGVVQEIKLQDKTVVIKHEEVAGYMPAMTMPFDVKDTNELAGLHPGDTVSFRIVDAGKDAWIDQIKKSNAAPVPVSVAQTNAGARPNYRFSHDVEPLKIGEPLPDYHFTNQLGQAISTGQFKGQALAFTFFFTRCPYPTFCPLMSNNFSEAQKKLLAMANGPTNWHLLSISFDTEFDSPEILKEYAQSHGYDPRHWDFVTGSLDEISAITDQVGENFWREGASISHNLRTVVVDARGRVQTIIPENKWTSDELVVELVKAAGAKP